ncbi:MAG: hypothetical protein OXF88_07825 [Rhodobacteraceae bacterium]|nr:hypothetical protein [Paracoccaceae bacterium]MCY4138411.1 hypothetical protein [Paracoccaceae bacterium]
MAVALSEELGSPMRIGHQTLAWIQAAVDAGMVDEDFMASTQRRTCWRKKYI